jgi:hypothetical protein
MDNFTFFSFLFQHPDPLENLRGVFNIFCFYLNEDQGAGIAQSV